MYAIVVDGGRQYRVEEGLRLNLDYRDAKADEPLVLDQVVLVSSDAGVSVGAPRVAGAKVTARVLGFEKGKKIVIRKFRRRKNYRRKKGHRQLYTTVQIEKIETA